jgi:molybdopterin-guanine dinucleotide biosynthesis protein A
MSKAPLPRSADEAAATAAGRWPGVILAGGRSRRMGGGDKGLRLLAGRPVLAHVRDRLAPQCGRLALNANGDPARFAGLGLPVLPDRLPEGVEDGPGPLAGVLAALDWAAGLGADAVVTAPSDTPFLPADMVTRLAAAGPFALAAGTTAGTTAEGPRLHPACGLWPVALRPALAAALAHGERRIGQWARAQGAAVAVFPAATPDPFLNLNTPEDLARAEALVRA